MVFVSLVRDKYTFLFVSDKLGEIGAKDALETNFAIKCL